MNAIEQILKLRWQLAEIQQRIESLSPDAINEALSRYSDNSRTSVIYRSESGKVVLRFVAKHGKSKLADFLKAEIQAEADALALKHKEQIAGLDQLIAEAESNLESLQNFRAEFLKSPRMQELCAQLEAEVASAVYKEPVLAYHFH